MKGGKNEISRVASPKTVPIYFKVVTVIFKLKHVPILMAITV